MGPAARRCCRRGGSCRARRGAGGTLGPKEAREPAPSCPGPGPAGSHQHLVQSTWSIHEFGGAWGLQGARWEAVPIAFAGIWWKSGLFGILHFPSGKGAAPGCLSGAIQECQRPGGLLARPVRGPGSSLCRRESRAASSLKPWGAHTALRKGVTLQTLLPWERGSLLWPKPDSLGLLGAQL